MLASWRWFHGKKPGFPGDWSAIDIKTYQHAFGYIYIYIYIHIYICITCNLTVGYSDLLVWLLLHYPECYRVWNLRKKLQLRWGEGPIPPCLLMRWRSNMRSCRRFMRVRFWMFGTPPRTRFFFNGGKHHEMLGNILAKRMSLSEGCFFFWFN